MAMRKKRLDPHANSLDGENKNNQAYRQIKELIIDGTFKPSQALREIELSQMLDVSRTPVREALRQLASENFVKYEVNKGVLVAEMNIAEVSDLMDARVTVETGAIRMFIKRMDDNRVLPELHDNLVLQKQALDREDYPAYAALDRAYHRLMVAGSKNERLIAFWQSLSDHTQLVMNRVFHLLGHVMTPSYDTHRDMFDAIIAKDFDAAFALTEQHINDLRSNIVTIILSMEDTPVESGNGCARKFS